MLIKSQDYQGGTMDKRFQSTVILILVLILGVFSVNLYLDHFFNQDEPSRECQLALDAASETVTRTRQQVMRLSVTRLQDSYFNMESVDQQIFASNLDQQTYLYAIVDQNNSIINVLVSCR